MPEASLAQSTLKRLIGAEDEAREILKAAEERAQSSVVGVREVKLLRSRLEAAESQAAIEMKQRLDQGSGSGNRAPSTPLDHSNACGDVSCSESADIRKENPRPTPCRLRSVQRILQANDGQFSSPFPKRQRGGLPGTLCSKGALRDRIARS